VNEDYFTQVPPRVKHNTNGSFDIKSKFTGSLEDRNGYHFEYTAGRTIIFGQGIFRSEGNMFRYEATKQGMEAQVQMRMMLMNGQLWSILAVYVDPTHPMQMVTEVVYNYNKIHSITVAPEVYLPRINTDIETPYESLTTQDGYRRFDFSQTEDVLSGNLDLLSSFAGESSLKLSLPLSLSDGISAEILAFLYSENPWQYDPQRFNPIDRAGIEFDLGVGSQQEM
jgi:hypothetical protein